MEDMEEVEAVETEDQEEHEDDSVLELEDFPEWKPGQSPVTDDQWDAWAKEFAYEDFTTLKANGFDLHVNWNKREVRLVDVE